jgi:hypothetical protein
MRFWYDTEFLEDGRTIDLISIGIVAEDGAEYYAVNEDITSGRLLRRIKRHDWLMANVVPSLPELHGDANLHAPSHWLFDYRSPLVKRFETIAHEVMVFLRRGQSGKDVAELWADYGAYDHVALCQLWGSMTDLPFGIPMYTNDIQQEAHRLGVTDLPQQAVGVHNALADARHCRTRWEFLQSFTAGTPEQ